MLNKVILIGRLTNDIEIRRTKENIPYTYFTLAVNRPGSEQTDFVSCVAWRGTAELMDKYVSKGSQVAIEGRLEVYRTENEGNYETRTNINVQSVQFLDSRREAPQSQKMESSNAGVNFEQEKATEEPKQEENKNQNEINFDDIKF